MRLDKYLKVSRIIKRRTVANEACDAECITVNGVQKKASYQVKPGDIIDVTIGRRHFACEVISTESAPYFKELSCGN